MASVFNTFEFLDPTGLDFGCNLASGKPDIPDQERVNSDEFTRRTKQQGLSTDYAPPGLTALSVLRVLRVLPALPVLSVPPVLSVLPPVRPLSHSLPWCKP